MCSPNTRRSTNLDVDALVAGVDVDAGVFRTLDARIRGPSLSLARGPPTAKRRHICRVAAVAPTDTALLEALLATNCSFFFFISSFYFLFLFCPLSQSVTLY